MTIINSMKMQKSSATLEAHRHVVGGAAGGSKVGDGGGGVGVGGVVGGVGGLGRKRLSA